MKAFTNSQFSYFSLIWMFDSRDLKNTLTVYMNELLQKFIRTI